MTAGPRTRTGIFFVLLINGQADVSGAAGGQG